MACSSFHRDSSIMGRVLSWVNYQYFQGDEKYFSCFPYSSLSVALCKGVSIGEYAKLTGMWTFRSLMGVAETKVNINAIVKKTFRVIYCPSKMYVYLDFKLSIGVQYIKVAITAYSYTSIRKKIVILQSIETIQIKKRNKRSSLHVHMQIF